MGLFSRLRGKVEKSSVMLVTERGNGYYAWNGNIYRSDIVRACIRPKVKAIGKLVGKHIRETIKADVHDRAEASGKACGAVVLK